MGFRRKEGSEVTEPKRQSSFLPCLILPFEVELRTGKKYGEVWTVRFYYVISILKGVRLEKDQRRENSTTVDLESIGYWHFRHVTNRDSRFAAVRVRAQ